jgi:hypothetical protein
LLTACPHFWLPHVVATDSGVQPHAPLLQVPASHPPQSSDCAQLSSSVPQRFEQKFAAAAHLHVLVVGSHVLFAPQSPHVRGNPQLSFAAPQCVLQNVGSGVQLLVVGPPTTPPSPAICWASDTLPSSTTPASSIDAASLSELRPEIMLQPPVASVANPAAVRNARNV